MYLWIELDAFVDMSGFNSLMSEIMLILTFNCIFSIPNFELKTVKKIVQPM